MYTVLELDKKAFRRKKTKKKKTRKIFTLHINFIKKVKFYFFYSGSKMLFTS